MHYYTGDERVTLLQACYDNPLFQDNGPGKKEESAPTPSSVPQDPRMTSHTGGRAKGDGPAHVAGVEFKRRRSKRLFTLAAVLLTVVILGLMVGLVLHFVGKPSQDEPARRKQSPVLFISKRLDCNLNVVGGPFSVYSRDLHSHNSSSFMYFSAAFKAEMFSVFQESHYRNIYNFTDVVILRPGSVHVEFSIFLKKQIRVSKDSLEKIKNLISSGMRKRNLFIVDPTSIHIIIEGYLQQTTLHPGSKTEEYRGTPPTRCEQVYLPMCVNKTSYTYAAFPNLLGQTTQEEALQVTLLYKDIWQAIRYDYNSQFWCSVLAPECHKGASIPPCQSFCEVVYKSCHTYYFGNFSWPLNCSILPESEDPAVCRQSPYKPGRCTKLENRQLCKLVDYNYTAFPNLVGGISEKTAAKSIKFIKEMQKSTKCYKHSVLFACATYLPKCSGTGMVPNHVIPPCRSLCKAFRSNCLVFMNIFAKPWPSSLNCSDLPDEDDPQVCVGYREAHEPPEMRECRLDELRCDNDTCIPPSWVCDGYQDCEDNLDELNCALCHEREFKCKPTSALCIPQSSVCDGTSDCYESVDERDCVRLGAGLSTGLLQVFSPNFSTWEPVCADGWNISFGHMVCEQLGYKSLVSTVFQPMMTSSKLVIVPFSSSKDPRRIQSYLKRGSNCTGNTIVKLTCGDPVCGTRPAHYTSPLRIVGGIQVKPGTWPWLVSLHGGPSEKFFCAGSLLNEEWVLTASHCLGGSSPSGIVIKVGRTRRYSYSRYRQVRHIRRLVMHRGYVYPKVDNDIALMQLASPVSFNDYVRPVCLPTPNEVVPVGRRCVAAGWGRRSGLANDYERVTRQVKLDIMSEKDCERALHSAKKEGSYELTSNMICAGGSLDHDACSGDSGGPFVCLEKNKSDTWFEAGIISWGLGCAIPNVPGIYTKLSNYVTWINQVLANYTGR